MRKLLHHLSIGRRLAAAFGMLCLLASSSVAPACCRPQQISLREDQERLVAHARRHQRAAPPRRERERLAGLHLRRGLDDRPGAAALPDADNMSGLIEATRHRLRRPRGRRHRRA